MPSLALTFLLKSQNSDGGWGYAAGQTSVVEPTAATLLVIAADEAAGEARRRAVDWLARGQHSDGGWGMSHADGASGWHTAWAVLALGRLQANRETFERGIAWLVGAEGIRFSGDDVMERGRQLFGIDLALRGWPWFPGEASWLEPTALALLALSWAARTSALEARLTEGVRYIQDRRCPAGGWNVGNPVMFDSALPARAHPTALALMALARLAPQAIQPDDVEALRADMRRDGGALALAWGLVALQALGEADEAARIRLLARQAPDGSWGGNVYYTAMTLLALEGRF